MANDKEQLRYWVWLQNVLGYECTRFESAIKEFKTAENIYFAERDLLKASGLFTAKQLSKINDTPLSSADSILADCENNGIKILPFGHKDYPNSLRNIPSPPIVIYVLGDLPKVDDIPVICIVGPRQPSDYGVKAAFSLSYRLSAGGFTIASGGALGIDTCAHSGALASGAKTIAVLGCGILDNYLMKNHEMRQTISKNGCLISEFQPRFAATRFSFPMRNRIMSGISDAVVVVEAKIKSGSIITAGCALEQGKEVYVIPGRPGNPNCEGSNKLIKDGAISLINADQIFDDYGNGTAYPNIIDANKAYNEQVNKEIKNAYKVFESEFFGRPTTTKTISNICEEKAEDIKINTPNLSELSASARQVLDAIGDDVFIIEQLNIDNINYGELSLIIAQLEMSGVIEAVPGGRYRKII